MMKFVFCCFLLVGFNVAAQVGSSSAPKKAAAVTVMVPPAVEQKFTVENPEASATWKKDGELYKALFINPVNNLGHITVYDKEGKVVRRERELEKQDCPPSINEYHDRKFPGEGFAIWISTDSTGNQVYYSQKNEHTYWFDKHGSPLNAGGGGLKDSLIAAPAPTR